MLNEDQNRPVTRSRWKKINKFLFEPHLSITEIGARREARLMATINLLIAFISLAGVVSVFNVTGLFRNVIVLFLLTLISFGVYALSRTQFHKFGSYVIVWALVATAFSVSDASRLIYSLHTNLILAFLIASITFPFRYMAFFVIFNNILIGLMPFVYPEFNEVGVILGEFIPISLLMLTIVYHRNNMERERIEESKGFNQELALLKTELEHRVEERTKKLEERARQLQVVTEVARTSASFQDLERLLSSSTRLISESFGYYHVGIYLLDHEGKFAILQAANSEGGQRMLSRMYKLHVDLNSIVGYTAKTQSARIALDTGADAVYFNNPDLPETRSEMALPLRVGMRTIGVLDVQSTEKEAFSEEEIAIVSTIGDQLALALDNTRLLNETRQALVTTEQTYQRYFSQSWSQFARRLNREGYRYLNGKATPLEKDDLDHVNRGSDSTLSIPLMVRGQDIGTLEIQPIDKKRAWTKDELAILEVAAERAAISLENARLLQDAQKRAAKERTISEGAARVSAALDVESILQATAEELERALGSSEIVIQLESGK